MTRRQALSDAVSKFLRDRDARSEQLSARRDLARACVEAHQLGISDQELANAFRLAANAKRALGRSRIQQIRQQGG